MLRQFSTKRIIGFFLLDFLGTQASLWVAYLLRSRLGELPIGFINTLNDIGITVGAADAIRYDLLAIHLQTGIYFMVAFLWPMSLIVFSVYDGSHSNTNLNELRNVFKAVCVATASLAGILFLTYRDTSRILLLIFFGLDLIMLLGSRIIFYIFRRSKRGRILGEQQNTLMIGAGDVAIKAVQQIQHYHWSSVKLIGYLDDDPQKLGRTYYDLPVLGNLAQIIEIITIYGVKNAVVALPLRAHQKLVEVCEILKRSFVRVYVIPDLFSLAFPNATVDGFGGIPVIDLGQPGNTDRQRLAKRMFDIIIASLLLIFFSPSLLLIAALIKLDSPGPIIYRQSRIGMNGKIFTMFKFRSMQANSDSIIHQEHVSRLIQENLSPEQLSGNNGGSLKIGNDPRVTRVGSIIRKTSLDELPQFINVLRGEMSLVGPRPDVPYAVDLYKEWHKRRFEVLPGVTGWWQVKGHNRVSYDEMIRMDIYYIEHMSLWMDIKILFLTPLEVLFGRGAG